MSTGTTLYTCSPGPKMRAIIASSGKLAGAQAGNVTVRQKSQQGETMKDSMSLSIWWTACYKSGGLPVRISVKGLSHTTGL